MVRVAEQDGCRNVPRANASHLFHEVFKFLLEVMAVYALPHGSNYLPPSVLRGLR